MNDDEGLWYFGNKRWAEISREERFICAKLFQHVEKDPGGFARWLAGMMPGKTKGLDLSGPWDVGYEVCFYRDLLHMAASGRLLGTSPEGARRLLNKSLKKRTFDLCLFSPSAVLLIEAKASARFVKAQVKSFRSDVTFLPSFLAALFGDMAIAQQLKVFLIGLAPSHLKFPKGKFDLRVSWKMIANRVHTQHVEDPTVFVRADGTKKDPEP